MESVNNSSSTTLYEQVRQIILSDIDKGVLKKGDKLPSETDLAAKYHVSRVTIRSALNSLEADNILVRKQGRGTFITSPITQYKADDHIGFTKSCLMNGQVPKTELLGFQLQVPKKVIREFLGLAENEPALTSLRMRYVDGRPISVETNYYAKNLSFLMSDDLNGSLFELLKKKYHITAIHGGRTLSIAYATAEEASLLKIKKNSPLLFFKDKLVDSIGKPLYYSTQVYLTDNFEISIY
ncbi:MAG: GntR family transcriptional regulator [Eubacterium sp.]|nr:GntR family transcriptional regulator [Eubacterium sp.]